MAVKRDVEKSLECSNALTRELEKLVKEVMAEANFISACKTADIQPAKSNTAVSQPIGDRLIRLKEVLKYLPVSKSHFYAGIKSGRYPQPEKGLGSRISAWRLTSIIKIVHGEVETL